MIINIEKPNGIYETYFFFFYYCITVGAKDYLKHGHAYGKSGLHNAAIKHFTHAIKLDPSMGLAFYYRGISYLHRKEHAKAIEDFTQAISFHTEVSGCFMFRGFAHKEIGDFEKANADIAKFLELNPGDKFANECFEEITKAQVRG
jgi:tetratricopeptide (TPR) repeat protein